MVHGGPRAAAPGRGRRALTLLALTGSLVILGTPAGASAATPAITSLYTTTQAAATAWSATAQALPAKVSAFASGTRAVAAVFSYSGAQAYSGSQFQLEILAQGGGIVAKSPFHLFVQSSGQYALIALHGPTGRPDGLPYPNGKYQAVIVVDGKNAAGAAFTVGMAQAASSPTMVINSVPRPTATVTLPRATATQRPAAPATATPVPAVADHIVPGKGLMSFYITSLTAAHGWSQNHAARPPHVTRFAAGTASVAGFFSYSSPSLLDGTYQMSIRSATGAVVSTSTFFVFLHTEGAAVLVGTHGMSGETVLSDNKPFAPGRYQAQLRFSSYGVVGVASFTVGA